MIGTTIEANKESVLFDQIDTERKPYYFRDTKFGDTLPLREELEMFGLRSPLTVIKSKEDKFVLVDGHRRFEAISQVRKEKGGWDEIPAFIIPSEATDLKHIFQILINKNVRQNRSYTIFNLADMISAFVEKGLAPADGTKITDLSVEDFNHLLSLKNTPPALRAKLNSSGMKISFVAQLAFQYQKWIKSPYAAYADSTVDKLIDHLGLENVSDHGWQFLLNFYWSDDKPFMAPRLKRS